MEWLGWIVAAILLLILMIRGTRRTPPPAASNREAAAGASPSTSSGSGGGEPGPGSPTRGSPSMDTLPPSLEERELRALRGTLGYLRRAVLPSLTRVHESLEEGDVRRESLEDALHAMEDLVFHADPPPEEASVEANVAEVVQLAVRAYTIETRVPVRVHAPPTPLLRALRPEALQDTVFLLLSNAGVFSRGKPIDVFIEATGEGEGFRVRVADEGPGFSEEAQARAFEPFWSSDPVGLGLGLPQARARVSELKGRISLRNREEGGAEVVVEVPGEKVKEG